MRPDSYKILNDCILRGIEWGWKRAHKHTDNPDEYKIKEEMELNIMNETPTLFHGISLPENAIAIIPINKNV